MDFTITLSSKPLYWLAADEDIALLILESKDGVVSLKYRLHDEEKEVHCCSRLKARANATAVKKLMALKSIPVCDDICFCDGAEYTLVIKTEDKSRKFRFQSEQVDSVPLIRELVRVAEFL